MNDQMINLRVAQKYDPCCTQILDKSGKATLYLFNSKENQWIKTETEGVFFFYKRSQAPFYSFLILNTRLSSANHIEHITQDLQLQLQLPFLLFKNNLGNIHSIWFYSEEDCERIAHTLGRQVIEVGGTGLKLGPRKIIGMKVPIESTSTQAVQPSELSNASATTTASSGGDILQMLAKAKHDLHTKPMEYSTAMQPPNSQIPASSGQAAPRPIDLNALFRNSMPHQGQPIIIQSGQADPGNRSGPVRPVAHRPNVVASQSQSSSGSFALPGTSIVFPTKPPTTQEATVAKSSSGAGMTVEELERMFRMAGPGGQQKAPTSQGQSGPPPTNQNSLLHALLPGQTNGGDSRSRPVTMGDEDDEGITDLLLKSSLKVTETASQLGNEDDEDLLTPGMLMTMSTDKSSGDLRTTGPVASSKADNLSAVSLTKEQLRESLIHLLKEDGEFLSKIHMAYLETLQRRLLSKR